MNPREQAVETLLRVNREGAYSNLEIRKVLSRHLFTPADERLYLNIVYGTLQNRLYLDDVLKGYTQNGRKIDPDVLEILRSALYQLAFLDRIPPYAVVDEAVNLCGRRQPRAKGFVNGVLRAYLRRPVKPADFDFNSYDNEKEALSLRYSIPLWIVHKYFEVYGREEAPEILSCLNDTPPLFIRVNTLKMDRQALTDALAGEGVETQPGTLSPDCLRVIDPRQFAHGIAGSLLYKAGAFTVQDQGAMAVAERLAPRPGESVLDMCAAPGGKTTHLAQLMENRGIIIARDVYANRLELVEAAASRLGAIIIQTECGDGTADIPADHNRYGRILLDAPCSGLGIIRRKPEIRYLGDKTSRKAIRQIQWALLRRAWDYLKPGGTLVYATCTVDPDENERQVQSLLKERENAVLDAQGYTYTSPMDDGCDGFFMCGIHKKK